MNEQTEPFSREAANIAARLIDEGPAPDDPDALARDVREGLYIGDVQEETSQFLDDTATLRFFGLLAPAIRSGGRNVPVSLRTLGFDHPYPRRSVPWFPFDGEYLIRSIRNWERSEPDFRILITMEAAVESFRVGVVDFLATRIASLVDPPVRRDISTVSLALPRTRLGTTRVRTVGFTVNVHTITSALRIHVSPTFRRSWRYFGMPTSPAISTLTGGIYEFGADGGPYSAITPDAGTFDIPYQTVSPSLNL